MENNITTKQKIGEFFRVNKSKIVKGTLLVTAVVAGVFVTKYLQTKGSANEVLELTTDITEETTEFVEEVIPSNN